MKIISLRTTAEKLGISLSTLKRLISAGALKKIQITERRVGVLESEVDDLISNEFADRGAA